MRDIRRPGLPAAAGIAVLVLSAAGCDANQKDGYDNGDTGNSSDH